MLVLTIVTMFKMQMQITLTTDADKDADADSLYERVQQFNCTFFLLGGAIDFFSLHVTMTRGHILTKETSWDQPGTPRKRVKEWR